MLWVCLMVGMALAQDWTVTPGEGVGALTVEMPLSSAAAILKPTRTIGPAGNPAFVEYGKELMIEYDSKRAAMISLHGNTFNTKAGAVNWTPYKGAKIGASWNSVASQMTSRKLSRKLPTAKGYPAEFYYAYPDQGIGFRVKGGSIIQVDLWKVRR